jgi:hypothetical protein
MERNIPVPWAVAAIVVVVLIVAVMIWRSQAPRAADYGGANIPTVNQYRGQTGVPGLPPR